MAKLINISLDSRTLFRALGISIIVFAVVYFMFKASIADSVLVSLASMLSLVGMSMQILILLSITMLISVPLINLVADGSEFLGRNASSHFSAWAYLLLIIVFVKFATDLWDEPEIVRKSPGSPRFKPPEEPVSKPPIEKRQQHPRSHSKPRTTMQPKSRTSVSYRGVQTRKPSSSTGRSKPSTDGFMK